MRPQTRAAGYKTIYKSCQVVKDIDFELPLAINVDSTVNLDTLLKLRENDQNIDRFYS